MPHAVLRSVLVAVLGAAVLSGCVVSRDPPTTRVQSTVEERKIEVARLRDRGMISYEEAARRQFAIQRNAYALTDGEMAFWRASIQYAAMVDRRQISPAEYRTRVAAAYAEYVPAPPR